MRTRTMTEYTNRIASALSAFALSLALIAGTVSVPATPSGNAAPAAQGLI
ncbi:MAG: hypothetical protein ACK40C_13305 [Novosphingobium meiothermophilum]